MSYKVDVLADSVSPYGVRLTTVEATFPRAYLSELNTHRMLSRNSESSRAIPPEIQIERVIENPYVPEFAGRVKGMGVGDALDAYSEEHARYVWLTARDHAVRAAQELSQNVAKDQVNRLLEPFMWHTAIISATDWDNFLNLRDHGDAALPMQRLAQLIREALNVHHPRKLNYGQWHTPFVDDEEMYTSVIRYTMADLSQPPYSAQASAGRCARSSYSTHHNPESFMDSVNRWQRLSKAGHWSPGEHVAQVMYDDVRVGNFRGWKQLRKHYAGEDVFQG